ncbi:MAG: BrnT family toxin [Desulfobacteraceae bacterium]|nr:BrnT family toxin [Desulfobacteraceae bacterium]
MSRFLPWDDADYIEIPLTTTDEVRYMVIGMVEGKVWSGIITYRSESIRIISVRRSRKEEIELYEG